MFEKKWNIVGDNMKKYEVLENLVKFNTIEDKENKEINDYIETVLKEYNFKTELKDKVLVMSIGNEKRIGFLGHTDTVNISGDWNTDPFKLEVIDNNIYGLGVCDMKGGLAAIIDAVREIDFTKLRYGIRLYFTYNEEINFGGIYQLVNNKEKFPNVMIYGEPTDNIPLIGSKGLLEFELNFNGKKAHASEPNKGKSANINAIKLTNELNNYYEENIKVETNNKYEIPYTTMNIGIINGGIEKNSVPDKCFVTLDFRPISIEHSDKIINKIDELSKEYDCTYKIFERVDPFYNEVDFIDIKETSNFITEASLVKNSNNIILGLGPVNPHQINEHISEDSYKKLVEQYKELIEKICK